MLAQAKVYEEDDYYNIPENIRAELIDGQLIYNQTAPSRIYQEISAGLFLAHIGWRHFWHNLSIVGYEQGIWR